MQVAFGISPTIDLAGAAGYTLDPVNGLCSGPNRCLDQEHLAGSATVTFNPDGTFSINNENGQTVQGAENAEEEEPGDPSYILNPQSNAGINLREHTPVTEESSPESSTPPLLTNDGGLGPQQDPAGPFDEEELPQLQIATAQGGQATLRDGEAEITAPSVRIQTVNGHTSIDNAHITVNQNSIHVHSADQTQIPLQINLGNQNVVAQSNGENINNMYITANTLAVESADSFTINSGSTNAYIISSAQNIRLENGELTIDHADSVIIGTNVVATNADNIKMPFSYQYNLFDLNIEIDDYDEIIVNQ